MRYISYCGNIYDKNNELEHNIDYIIKAINEGYDVMIYIEIIDNNFYIGLNNKYIIDNSFLEKYIDKLWFNVINNKTIIELKKKFININFINNINSNDIYYLPELLINTFPKKKENIKIICSSHIGWYKQLYEAKIKYAITINGRFTCQQENLFPQVIKYLNENKNEWIDIYIAVNDDNDKTNSYLNDKYMNYPFIAYFHSEKFIIPDKYINYCNTAPETNIRNVISDFYTKTLLSKEILLSNNDYDLIMKYRSDIVANQLPNLKEYLYLKNIKNTVLIPNTHHYGHQCYSINDQICISNKETIHIYLNIYNFIDKYLNDDNIILHPETLVHHNLLKNNINIILFDYNYFLNDKRKL